ncbi:signal recognition particle, SRP54 subunit [Thermococcus onnurineus NA1]|uniref:Signal recognition particle 54 kDa protein n=1 Tax=Thermococcus onnurineus (strain NA1) TaxID=523850 RepID=SRP54_THEON|nr:MULTISPECIES: signal recognition particle protein Srp54 [Thermococcus]B6YSS1.1 RecName: Full=Signal recognition particle 54 kDa protein; Short=SRP54 [Thermococcus onnurineus NA1]ACJ15608.1 signal recognition particle, SRP54 subunit [Thermococcus onnurineus NA1]NJE47056.1 signal recognition particle protein [Thermococcus sp. GR7]NJE78119.1 signal recognition particle protein [Thermococcus sp. GR4]NJF22764.1 signal recognition particle protein [Thermococcus sp. GR5]
MALEKLGKALNNALRKLARSSTVDEATIKEVVRDIQRALIQADVNVRLVLDLTKRIEKRALEEEPPTGVSKKEHIIKIVYEELTKFLGTEAKPIEIKEKPTVLLTVGIQGSGKTTSIAKLARYFQKRGYKVGLVCSDTWRPGAYQQLKQLVEPFGIEVFGDPEEKDAIKLAKEGVEHFREKGVDIIIVDSAGRHKEEKSLIEEMKQISAAIKPHEVILVIDGTIGQQAYNQALAFKEATPIGSIIVTKLDGSAKGGGALSAVAATGAPIKFIGVGERIDDLEPFDPKRFVSRLLGLGDIQGLLEKFEELQKQQEFREEDLEKFLKGKFNLKDMYAQLEAMQKMGPLKQILQMIPGMGYSLPDDAVRVGEERLKKFKVIMDSMTEEELEHPEIINYSRIKRIARGSGTSIQEVRELLHQYNQMKKMFKSMDKRKLSKMARKFNLGGFGL